MMRKWLSRFAAVIGVIALVWAAYCCFRFGATNMRRVETAASAWRTTGEFH